MKNKLSKAVAAILIIATVLSMASVFAFAEADDTATESTLNLLVNRSFDEGWDYDNGLIDFAKNQEFKIDYFIYGMVMTILPMIVGFIFAKYILKINVLTTVISIIYVI